MAADTHAKKTGRDAGKRKIEAPNHIRFGHICYVKLHEKQLEKKKTGLYYRIAPFSCMLLVVLRSEGICVF